MEQRRTDHHDTTGIGAWPTDLDSLMAFSDAAAAVGLWAAAARLGEHAVSPDPRYVETRLEVAWRMWRAGRPGDALGLLAALPDEVHPSLPVLRAAAVATRDRTPAGVGAMLATAGRLPVSPQNLMIIALAAREVGDRAVAFNAAQRYLATVRPDAPALRDIVAPLQAMNGEMAAAVASTEQACAGLAADADAPVDRTAGELRAAGRDDLAARYLAEGVLQTGRPRYGELLDQLLPARVRDRSTWILAPPLLVVLVVLIGVSARLPGDMAAAGLLPLVAAGLAASSWGILTRLPGTGLAQTHRIVGALNRHRKRVGRSGLVLPALAAAVAGFGYGAWKGATRTTETLTRITLLPLLIGLLFAVGAVAVVAVGRWRRARARARLDERVPADRCHCWERDWFAGRAWRDYRDGHLTTVAADRGQGAALLRCPTTAKTWLHVDESDLTVHVVLPEPSDADRHSAAYM
jgi:hypothetical protein